MHRRPLIAGNWKMHLTLGAAVQLARSLALTCSRCEDREVMIAPAFTALAAVVEAVKGTAILVGAQNIAWEKEGAFTGEVSGAMLKDLGVVMPIIGHSERRQIFAETDAMINRRLHAALGEGLRPILCVGETLDDRQDGRTFEVLEQQVLQGLNKLDGARMREVVLAYEPVWAIGTGQTATREQAQEVHLFLRGLLTRLFEKNIAESVRILYGGSVKPDNIDDLMAQPDIDGALVGGAALNAESFSRIVHFQ